MIGITVLSDRSVTVTGTDAGAEKENNITRLSVNTPEAFLSYDKYIEFEVSDGTKVMSPALGYGALTFTYTLPCQVLAEGLLTAQVTAKSGDVVWKSDVFYLRVKPGLNATEFVIEQSADVLQDLRERMRTIEEDVGAIDQAVVDAQTAQGGAEEAAGAAIENAVTATEQAEIAATKAGEALQSENNAKASEEEAALSAAASLASKLAAALSEGNAAQSEIQAAQALSDLLAMLGTDVATLTGGKLTPSQIPDLSINDVFTVEDTGAMLVLDAQRGDCALIMDGDVVSDSYILAADDPTVLSNWKKLGVSFVANAGHANTADNAANAAMINNKRLVSMTQTQYDTAYASGTLEDNAYYVVVPDPEE